MMVWVFSSCVSVCTMIKDVPLIIFQNCSKQEVFEFLVSSEVFMLLISLSL